MEHTDHNAPHEHPPSTPDVPSGNNGHGGQGASENYGADKIKVLEGLEAVRKRPAMYIGSTGPAGLHHLVYEVVDNSIDEALGGFCDEVNVTIHIDGSVTVADNGHGIPVDQHVSGKSAAELVLEIWRNGQVYHQTYERGNPTGELEITGTTKRRGTKVTFKPDAGIFETV